MLGFSVVLLSITTALRRLQDDVLAARVSLQTTGHSPPPATLASSTPPVQTVPGVPLVGLSAVTQGTRGRTLLEGLDAGTLMTRDTVTLSQGTACIYTSVTVRLSANST